MRQEHRIFTTFDAALEHIQGTESLFKNSSNRSDSAWWRIEKWVPGKNNKLEERFHWTISTEGDIWFINYRSSCEPRRWVGFCGGKGELNLPLPFQPGDIVMGDCQPFMARRLVLILSLGDNHDWFAVKCLFITSNGQIDIANFKSNNLYSSDEKHLRPFLSNIYRICRYDGELAKHELPFGVLSTEIKKNPALGEYIMNKLQEKTTIVSDVIYEWKPKRSALITYTSEIEMITDRISSASSVDEIARVIKDVLDMMFGSVSPDFDERFYEQCVSAAEKIKNKLTDDVWNFTDYWGKHRGIDWDVLKEKLKL